MHKRVMLWRQALLQHFAGEQVFWMEPKRALGVKFEV